MSIYPEDSCVDPFLSVPLVLLWFGSEKQVKPPNRWHYVHHAFPRENPFYVKVHFDVCGGYKQNSGPHPTKAAALA